MNNMILKSSVKIITPLILLFSLVVMLKGHNEPGGGFIGGLLGALGWLVYRLGTGNTKLPANMLYVMAIGLAICCFSGLYSVVMGVPFLTGFWGPGIYIPSLGDVKLSTVTTFDFGVYIVVLGAAIRMLSSFMAE